ncbi:thiol-disulfide oxidoreductase DCC family protein [Thalassotalea euphylliae]|uniref:thiol-disulfide oxidoreductase DCC family protein n=1 Tax=Thalassotalea euphylliae TaxID=1655234 RepID=UPI00362E908B
MNTCSLPSGAEHGIIVLYDGACPTCVEDRQKYERFKRIEHSNIIWLDLNTAPDVLNTFNIEEQDAISELHLIVNGKQVVKELDAYILLFAQIPRFKWLAVLIGLPLIKPLLSRYYRYRVQKRLQRTNRL